MPPTTKHFVTSVARTGKDYAELHNWIDDSDLIRKYERHNFTNIWKFGPEIKAGFGEEGVAEYIEHLREDIENKISKLVPECKETLKDAFVYFGFTRKERDPAIAEAARRVGANAVGLIDVGCSAGLNFNVDRVSIRLKSAGDPRPTRRLLPLPQQVASAPPDRTLGSCPYE